ncbi:filaggrin-2-like [Tyto alba]|uniref:filaggrin-2-like n=1 Tax=Tyto alba TaxID=56313 RepID=UPI001C686EA5|nr:filaggrin-2-like [Tyto alba]
MAAHRGHGAHGTRDTEGTGMAAHRGHGAHGIRDTGGTGMAAHRGHGAHGTRDTGGTGMAAHRGHGAHGTRDTGGTGMAAHRGHGAHGTRDTEGTGMAAHRGHGAHRGWQHTRPQHTRDSGDSSTRDRWHRGKGSTGQDRKGTRGVAAPGTRLCHAPGTTKTLATPPRGQRARVTPGDLQVTPRTLGPGGKTGTGVIVTEGLGTAQPPPSARGWRCGTGALHLGLWQGDKNVCPQGQKCHLPLPTGHGSSQTAGAARASRVGGAGEEKKKKKKKKKRGNSAVYRQFLMFPGDPTRVLGFFGG